MKSEKPNGKILAKLRKSFDTEKLGEAVDAVERLAQLKDVLRTIHQEARVLVDGAPSGGRSRPSQPLWALADEVMCEVGEQIEKLRDLKLDLEQLVYLDPKMEADDLP